VTDIAPSNIAAPSPKTGSTIPLALVVTIGMALVLVLTVITLAYSNHNTPASVNGTTVTTSHYITGPTK
jgi:hypothetical protein